MCVRIQIPTVIKKCFLFQAYRVCEDGRHGHAGAGTLCPNGTLFNQVFDNFNQKYSEDLNNRPLQYSDGVNYSFVEWSVYLMESYNKT